MSLDAAPVPVTHLPRLQLCDQNAIPPSWAIGTFGMGHNGDTESPFPLAGHPPPHAGQAARWLPAHPDTGAAVAALPLPLQHSESGYAHKDNLSTGAQLPP